MGRPACLQGPRPGLDNLYIQQQHRAQGRRSIISINGAENSKAIALVSGTPYLGRVSFYPIYLLIMFCFKQRFPYGCSMKQRLGDVNGEDRIHLEKDAYRISF